MKTKPILESLIILTSTASLLPAQLLAPDGIEFGKGLPTTERPRILPSSSTDTSDVSFTLQSKYADLVMNSSWLKLMTKISRDPAKPIYNGMQFLDWSYGGGEYKIGSFPSSSIWTSDKRGSGSRGWTGDHYAAQFLTGVSTDGNGAYLELEDFDSINAPPGMFTFWGVDDGVERPFLQLTQPLALNSWSAFKLGGSLSVHDTDGTDALTTTNERFKLSINPAGQDTLLLKKLAVTLDEVTFSGPMTIGGYPVLTTGAGSLALFGGATSNGGIVALGYATKATANAATAFGWQAEANGGAAFAAGDRVIAGGLGAAALGSRTKALMDGSFAAGQETTASKACSLAFGFLTTADGVLSIAMGRGASAMSDDSLALGKYSYSIGEAAVAIGNTAHAHGGNSTSLGPNTATFSDNSTALGSGAWAWKNGQTVVGRNNLIPMDYPRYPLSDGFMMPQNDTTLDDADEVLVVGGGNSGSSRRNAMVVQASGDTKILGSLAAAGSAAVGGNLTVGTATISSTAAGEVVLKVPAKGGISMGIYMP